MITAVASLAALILATSAFAQSDVLRANIPFDFYVAGKLLPAGTYTITPSSGANVIRVADGKGNSAYIMAVAEKANRAKDTSRLVFRRYGGTTSFLSGVYWLGFSNGRELETSEMERQIAKNGSTPVPIALIVK